MNNTTQQTLNTIANSDTATSLKRSAQSLWDAACAATKTVALTAELTAETTATTFKATNVVLDGASEYVRMSEEEISQAMSSLFTESE